MKLDNPFKGKNKKDVSPPSSKDMVPILTIVSNGDYWKLVEHNANIPEPELINILLKAAQQINARAINDLKNRKG
jgi:hypothetical protein